jgi:osmotically inducible protein OsmC
VGRRTARRLGPDAGGFRISGIALTVRGEVDGLDEAAFVRAAEAAKEGCPVSKAPAAVDITLAASLVTSPPRRSPRRRLRASCGA